MLSYLLVNLNHGFLSFTKYINKHYESYDPEDISHILEN